MHEGSAPPDHIPRLPHPSVLKVGRRGRPLLTWLRASRLAFDGVLDPAHRVLHLALGLVQLAFALQLLVAGRLPAVSFTLPPTFVAEPFARSLSMVAS